MKKSTVSRSTASPNAARGIAGVVAAGSAHCERTSGAARRSPQSHNAESGQGTAEYALILVAVATLAAVVIAYLAGSGGGLITDLFGVAFAKLRGVVGVLVW